MTGQLHSEALKLRTTRTATLLVLGAAALTLLGAVIEGVSPTTARLAHESTQRTVFGAAGSTAVLFATLLGLLAVTTEFRYGTIRSTLLVEPRRRVVLAAKIVTSTLGGILLAVACLVVAFAAGFAILAVRDVDLALSAAHTPALTLGTIAASGLGGALGVAIGTLVRNQVGAIVALVGYAVAVDAVLFAAAPSVGRYLPGKAGDALTGQPVEHLLAPGSGAVVLAAWTLALLAAAAVRTEHSDI
jgi:ABC-type transport system involved in multi-copper enzyme maturation permease subunit